MSAIGPHAARSSAETGFTIDTDAGDVALAMVSIPERIHESLLAEEHIIAGRVVARARELAATLRKVRTGAYVASFKGIVDDEPDAVIGRVFSGDPAANILEWGGTIPEHVIAPATARALHFAAFLRGDVFAARVLYPGAEIKGKPVLHQALAELAPEIVDRLVHAGVGKIDAMEF
jgi:hypothetical protein